MARTGDGRAIAVAGRARSETHDADATAMRNAKTPATPASGIKIIILWLRRLRVILERVEGIEPSYLAWKATALPLSYTRAGVIDRRRNLVASGNNLSRTSSVLIMPYNPGHASQSIPEPMVEGVGFEPT